MNRLEAGKIINTHGLRGEVKVSTWTNYPEDFEDIAFVYVKRKTGEERLDIKGIKYQKNNLIVKFQQINSIDEAQTYKNLVLYVDRDQLPPLPDGVYYIVDLIGLKVYDDNNEFIGEIADVFDTGANKVYDVKREGKKNLLLPVIDEVVKKVDLENRRVDVHILEGLDD